jgi:hypothetical protein
MRTRYSAGPRRHRLDEPMLNLRTFGFLARHLWRPSMYAAGARVARLAPRRR